MLDEDECVVLVLPLEDSRLFVEDGWIEVECRELEWWVELIKTVWFEAVWVLWAATETVPDHEAGRSPWKCQPVLNLLADERTRCCGAISGRQRRER